MAQSCFNSWNLERNVIKSAITRPRKSLFETKIYNFINTFDTSMIFKSNKILLDEFIRLKSKREKVRFVRFNSNRYFSFDIFKRGFRVSFQNCQLCTGNSTGKPDTFKHYVKEHYNRSHEKVSTRFNKLSDENLIKIFYSLDIRFYQPDLVYRSK